jgi:hypothetical protein
MIDSVLEVREQSAESEDLSYSAEDNHMSDDGSIIG